MFLFVVVLGAWNQYPGLLCCFVTVLGLPQRLLGFRAAVQLLLFGAWACSGPVLRLQSRNPDFEPF